MESAIEPIEEFKQLESLSGNESKKQEHELKTQKGYINENEPTADGAHDQQQDEEDEEDELDAEDEDEDEDEDDEGEEDANDNEEQDNRGRDVVEVEQPSEEGTATDKSSVLSNFNNRPTNLDDKSIETNANLESNNNEYLQHQNENHQLNALDEHESSSEIVKEEEKKKDEELDSVVGGQSSDNTKASKQEINLDTQTILNSVNEDEDDEEEEGSLERKSELLFKEAEEEQEEDNKDKISQNSDNQEELHDDKSANLGRNRRVRQKNRYFLDFHCIDLTKGGRSNKDDYDAYTTATTTRTSNRRSTTDSNRGQLEEPEGLMSRYCRRCLIKTPHGFDGGCQACLYKKIVENSKRAKPASQRNRSANQRPQQDSNSNELQPSSTSTFTSTSTSTSTTITATTSNGNKRKATKQAGPTTKSSNNTSNTNNNNGIGSNNINNSNNTNNTTTNKSGNITATNNIINSSNTNNEPNTAEIYINTPINNEINPTQHIHCQTTIDDKNSAKSGDKLPKLDSWTPEEVANYILSKGFAQEAELFKTQSVDGISLLLMQRTDFTYGLKIKLGPALKIYDQVCKLKRDYFRAIA